MFTCSQIISTVSIGPFISDIPAQILDEKVFIMFGYLSRKCDFLSFSQNVSQGLAFFLHTVTQRGI